ncbi:OPT oligopeptide transporter protein-domain-containing protein [Jimgerdemannia flammicorona]|uniref:OPT oligopeptide transporter protein-domain-containing protein n=1 Tax=Jimgerdemannia flammicorona TaxID=994334 RepID=A0A433A0R3_9FUNG|nr:OPT oligopeptide transporter protein-domain-containing protein [Jimgerdemannia flammicorona]
MVLDERQRLSDDIALDSMVAEVDDEVEPTAEEIAEFQFTWRASVTGSLLGCFVSASNMYLGLKIGWSFESSLFGAIFSFALIKPMSCSLPPWLGGGYFGPKENCSAQTVATTAGSLSAGLVSGIPAMYKLGLLSANPMSDITTLTLWTLCAAFYGLFFAIPLWKYFIIKQDLAFPTHRAAAEMIKSLHESADCEKDAMKKARWLIYTFEIVFLWTIIGLFLPIFDTVHLLYWIGVATSNNTLQIADQVWRWQLTFDFPFFGAGMMTRGATIADIPHHRINAIAYGIAGPILMANGLVLEGYGFKSDSPSAQSWFLWPGIALMIFSSFTEIFIRYDVLWNAVLGGCRELGNTIRTLLKKAWESTIESDDDPVPLHEQVPVLWWSSGLIISVIFTCAIMRTMFGMPVYQALFAVFLGFLLSFFGIQASGK